MIHGPYNVKYVFFYCAELADYKVTLSVVKTVVLNGRMIDEYLIVRDVGWTVLELIDTLYCELLRKFMNYMSGWMVPWLRLEQGSKS